MQGRLQGKRLHGRYFLDIVVDHGTEGCNYLLGVDIDMNTVAGYAITSWDRGYGDMEFVLDLDTVRLLTHLPATAMVQCDLIWPDHTPVSAVAAQHPEAADGPRRRARLHRVRRHRARVHRVRGHLRGGARPRLPGPDPVEPVQRRLLHRRHHPRRAAAARHPQHDVRRRAQRRGRQGRVQLRPARDRLPVRRRPGHRRQPRRLQDGRQGDRLPARQVADLHGRSSTSARATPATSTCRCAARTARSSSGTTRPGAAPRSTTSSSPAYSRRCRT